MESVTFKKLVKGHAYSVTGAKQVKSSCLKHSEEQQGGQLLSVSLKANSITLGFALNSVSR